MSKNDSLVLGCGCVILRSTVLTFCGVHESSQPKSGDPLMEWLDEEHNKKLGICRPNKDEVTEFSFFNDGKKDLVIRTTPKSYKDQPERIKPLEMKTLYVRPNGFVKLWDCEDFYHLLVE